MERNYLDLNNESSELLDWAEEHEQKDYMSEEMKEYNVLIHQSFHCFIYDR